MSGSHTARKPFGRITAEQRELVERYENTKALDAGLQVMRTLTGKLLSSAPNSYTRQARVAGLMRSAIKAVAPTAVSGKTVSDAVAELDRLELVMLEALEEERRDILRRRISGVMGQS